MGLGNPATERRKDTLAIYTSGTYHCKIGVGICTLKFTLYYEF